MKKLLRLGFSIDVYKRQVLDCADAGRLRGVDDDPIVITGGLLYERHCGLSRLFPALPITPPGQCISFQKRTVCVLPQLSCQSYEKAGHEAKDLLLAHPGTKPLCRPVSHLYRPPHPPFTPQYPVSSRPEPVRLRRLPDTWSSRPGPSMFCTSR